MIKRILQLCFLVPVLLNAQNHDVFNAQLAFRTNNTVLLKDFMSNYSQLASIEKWITKNYKQADPEGGYIQIVANYTDDTPQSINRAAVQASTTVSYLRGKSGDSTFRYTFYLNRSTSSDRVDVRCINGSIPAGENQRIYFTESTDPEIISRSVARYPSSVYLNNSEQKTSAINNPNSPQAEVVKSKPITNPSESNTTVKVEDPQAWVHFRYANETIYAAYRQNKTALAHIKQILEQNRSVLMDQSGHINLIAYIPSTEAENPAAINFTSIRTETLRTWMKQNYDWLENNNFSFYIVPDTQKEGIEVSFEATPIAESYLSEIWFTQDIRNPEKIIEALSRYKSSPVVEQRGLPSISTINFDILNTALDNTQTTKIEGAVNEQMMLTLYYRLNKDIVDVTYLTNRSTLRSIDSLLNLPSAAYIDTLRITAFASPEGAPAYNLALSQRRANSMRDYILQHYPQFANRQVVAEGRGMNWAGLQRMAEADSNLPFKAELLAILNSPTLTQEQRQQQIQRINNGRLYRDYLHPRYYPHLRSGASLFVAYNPGMPVDIDFEPIAVPITEPVPPPPPVVAVEPEPEPTPIPVDTIYYRRPIAIKTNMLFDLLTLFNLEIEIPIGKKFSVLGEWTFPFWGGLGNAGGVAPLPAYSEKYTLQMLSGMIEGRYWFRRNDKLDRRAWTWGDYNPLNGWFVGLFGGAGLYDAQLGKHGMQGEFYIASGLSVGYAHPIAKNFHLEYSVGAGYIATRYYNYTLMDGHKVVDIRQDGKYDRRQQSLIGPTRLKVSLVWIPQFKVKGNK